jgi:hypothetical protein
LRLDIHDIADGNAADSTAAERRLGSDSAAWHGPRLQYRRLSTIHFS